MKYLDEVLRLSKMSYNIDERDRFLKLNEEVGELNANFLAYINSDTKSKSASGTPMDILEESCDVINCVMDIICQMMIKSEITEGDFNKMFIKKLNKWENKLK